MNSGAPLRLAVIIPSFKVTKHILGVVARIGPEVDRIYIVDDKCPEGSGDFVEKNCPDKRVVVLKNSTNQGVGGAVIAGYRAAILDGMDVLIKVDGDGQMDPSLIPQLVAPILDGTADYTKGNRFFSPEALTGMPATRLIGNAGLSFLTKAASGYWDIVDPTNGYTAIHAHVADVVPLEKLAKRYFFESDLLFRLNTVRAVVADIPMFAVYADEKSSLSPARVFLPFLFRNVQNAWKRVLYSYFLRGFSFASFCLVFGIFLFVFGFVFGVMSWLSRSTDLTPTGTIMISVVPLILGFQLLMGFVAADIASTPSRPLQGILRSRPAKVLKPFADISAGAAASADDRGARSKRGQA